jgi:hypothetical protein
MYVRACESSVCAARRSSGSLLQAYRAGSIVGLEINRCVSQI